jgi:lipopolysaccharide biosynthesis glycosyltransferase
MAPKTIIVSAANQAYWPLLSGFLNSIDKRRRGAGMTIGVLDLGLAGDQVERLRQYGAQVVVPEWDYDTSAFTTPPPPYFKAMTARPFLPRYFAGYDVYVWIDADCWVQDWHAVRMLCASAEAEGFAIVPELDRSYTPFLSSGGTFHDWTRSCFATCLGEDEAARLQPYPLLNCGVFAATNDTPIWALWSKRMADVLARVRQPFFFAEQTALNACIREANVPVALLPARYNWMCSRAFPCVGADGKALVEPQPPFEPLGIIHVAAGAKQGIWPLAGVDGRIHHRALTFPPLP